MTTQQYSLADSTPPLVPTVTVSFRAQRYIYALSLNKSQRTYSIKAAMNMWIKRVCKKNGLVPGHDVHAKLMQHSGKRRLVIRFDAAYVGDIPANVQEQVWSARGLLQVGRDLRIAVLPNLSVVGSAPIPVWAADHDETYHPHNLHW